MNEPKVCKDCKWITGKGEFAKCHHSISLKKESYESEEQPTIKELVVGIEKKKEKKPESLGFYCSTMRSSGECGGKGKLFVDKFSSTTKKPGKIKALFMKLFMKPKKVDVKVAKDFKALLEKYKNDPSGPPLSEFATYMELLYNYDNAKKEKIVDINSNAPSLFEDWEQ